MFLVLVLDVVAVLLYLLIYFCIVVGIDVVVTDVTVCVVALAVCVGVVVIVGVGTYGIKLSHKIISKFSQLPSFIILTPTAPEFANCGGENIVTDGGIGFGTKAVKTQLLP
jgi:hypothetical protein